MTPDDIKEARQAYDAIAPILLRDLAAIDAMKALLSSDDEVERFSRDSNTGNGYGTGDFGRELAMNAYEIADAMLWARSHPPKATPTT